MNDNNAELRIVQIKEDLGQGKYLSEDVFSQENIGVKLLGKQRMHFRLPIEAVIYVSIRNLDKDNAWYIYTWKDTARLDNTETALEEQKKELDTRYIEFYGNDKFDYIRVYSESKKFKH